MKSEHTIQLLLSGMLTWIGLKFQTFGMLILSLLFLMIIDCTKSLARRLVLSTWFYYFFSKKSVFLKIKVAVFLYMFYC